MDRRFFSETPVSSDSITLDGSEAQHIAKVLRAQRGESVTVFDGTGVEFTAQITAISRGRIELQVVERNEVSREAGLRLVMGVALPKGDRQRILIEKCVELGVTRLVPLTTNRGVALPNDSTLERLRRGVIEASKQCGRNVLMEIAQPQSIGSFLESADAGAVRWLAHPEAAPPESVAATSPTDRNAMATLVFAAVGPEGGFDESEARLAKAAGWQRVSLGNSILRVETSALALAAHWLLQPKS